MNSRKGIFDVGVFVPLDGRNRIAIVDVVASKICRSNEAAT